MAAASFVGRLSISPSHLRRHTPCPLTFVRLHAAALTLIALCFTALAAHARVDPRVAHAMAAKIKDLQIRSGQLSSHKALAVSRSPWPLVAKPQSNVSQAIAIYRIIGNPLPPRHDLKQLNMNLQYMLTSEPDLPSAKKIFVLNRLDPPLESFAQRLIESYGYEVLIIKFEAEDFRAYQSEDTFGLHPNDWGELNQPKFYRLNANLYLMNNNGARNIALRDGIRRGFRWTLPLDGNCFFTLQHWANVLEQLNESESKGIKYAAIPMVRTIVDPANVGGPIDEITRRRKRQNQSPRRLNEDFSSRIAIEHAVSDMPGIVSTGVSGEHQIAFHRSATLRFDPTVPYGHRPKVSFLWKLRIPGAWDNWNHDVVFRAEGECHYLGFEKSVKVPSVCSRTLPRPHAAAESEAKEVSALVNRLPDNWPRQLSDVRANDSTAVWNDNYDARHNRKNVRDVAIVNKVDEANARFPPTTRAAAHFVKPLFLNIFSMETMRRECLIHGWEAAFFRQTPREPPYRDNHPRRRVHSRRIVYGEHHCHQIEHLVALASRRISNPPFSVVDKAEYVRKFQQPLLPGALYENVKLFPDPPSNATAHHYQNLGMFDWRVAELPDVDPSQLHLTSASHSSLNASSFVAKLQDENFRNVHAEEFVNWEGHVRPDGRLWGAGSEAYDRSRSYDMMTNVTLFALAHFYTGEARFATKAVSLIRTWFLDDETKMLPSHAFMRWSRQASEPTGILQLRELTYTFDALALIQRSTAWTDDDNSAMSSWCAAYAADIAMARDRNSTSIRGWWFALQYAAVSRCAGQNVTGIQDIVMEKIDRLLTLSTMRTDGALPREAYNGNPFFSTYAPILAWRFFQNSGEVGMSARIAKLIQSTVRMLLTEEKLKNSEIVTPICQWALDFDREYGLSLDVCKRKSTGSSWRTSSSEMTPLPSAEIQQFYPPPLLPTRPASGLFPFMNLLW